MMYVQLQKNSNPRTKSLINQAAIECLAY